MKKIPTKVAYIDMDGTIADHHEGLHEHLVELASPEDPPVPENPHDSPQPWMRARIDLIHHKNGFWINLKPIRLGFQVMSLLQDLYEIHVLTKGPHYATSAWSEKRDWCHTHLPPGTPVTITEDKALLHGDVLFDDFPPYIVSWLGANPQGKVIMLDYTYNRDFSHPRVYRVKSEDDLAGLKGWLESNDE